MTARRPSVVDRPLPTRPDTPPHPGRSPATRRQIRTACRHRVDVRGHRARLHRWGRNRQTVVDVVWDSRDHMPTLTRRRRDRVQDAVVLAVAWAAPGYLIWTHLIWPLVG